MAEGHICQCLARIRILRRESPVTIAGARRRTGEEFVDGVLGLARGLSESGLVRRGDVVAIAALNSDWYMEWLLAITYVGGIVAPLNYRWSFEEARSAMEIVSPVMLVVDDLCSSWALALQEKNHMPSLRMYALIGDSSSPSPSSSRNVFNMNSMRRPSQGATNLDLIPAPNGIALICFTSGTTGEPKAVTISHTALIVQSLAKISIVGYAEDDVYLHTAPLCHIGGISSCIAMLMAGGCHVIMPKFDAHSSFLAIKEHQVTSLITVPAMMADLVSFRNFEVRKVKDCDGGETVKKILNGGGGLSAELMSIASHIFRHAKIISAYGMTEACSSLTFKTLHDPTPQKSEMLYSNNDKVKNLLHDQHGGVPVGKPAPHVELRISGNGNSSSAPLVGSILTRGLHVMTGYWGLTTTHTKQGWLDTGDVGWLDSNGDLWLVGRQKDRIKSGGENVYPEEVEAILSQHPGVLKAIVIGIHDIRLSEMVVTCVSIRENWKWVDQKLSNPLGVNELSDEILRSYCRQRNLTGFKIPKIFILWRKPFPLTTTGKLKRDDVKREAMSYMQLVSSRL